MTSENIGALVMGIVIFTYIVIFLLAKYDRDWKRVPSETPEVPKQKPKGITYVIKSLENTTGYLGINEHMLEVGDTLTLESRITEHNVHYKGYWYHPGDLQEMTVNLKDIYD